MRSPRIKRALTCVTAFALVATSACNTPAAGTGSRLVDSDPGLQSLDPGLRAQVDAIAAGLTYRSVHYAPVAQPAVELRFYLEPGERHAQRTVDATVLALDQFGRWFGPFPHATLTVIDAPWRSDLAGASFPRLVIGGARWLSPAIDLAPERALFGALAHQYWLPLGHDRSNADAGWLREGITLYTGTRAVHEAFARRNFLVERFFGGFVPLPIRSVVLSPDAAGERSAVLHFPEIESPGDRAQRAATALLALERFIGWPALQQALAAFRARSVEEQTPSTLARIAGEQRGGNLDWFFAEAFRADVTFDYAIGQFTSAPAPGDPGKFDTVVSLRRHGEGVFASARGLPVAVRFADGTEVRDWWDGREQDATLAYRSKSPAVLASVDPDVILVLDADRSNNTRSLQPLVHPVGVRLALHWLVWLQDVMLTYSALL